MLHALRLSVLRGYSHLMVPLELTRVMLTALTHSMPGFQRGLLENFMAQFFGQILRIARVNPRFAMPA